MYLIMYYSLVHYLWSRIILAVYIKKSYIMCLPIYVNYSHCVKYLI